MAPDAPVTPQKMALYIIIELIEHMILRIDMYSSHAFAENSSVVRLKYPIHTFKNYPPHKPRTYMASHILEYVWPLRDWVEKLFEVQYVVGKSVHFQDIRNQHQYLIVFVHTIFSPSSYFASFFASMFLLNIFRTAESEILSPRTCCKIGGLTGIESTKRIWARWCWFLDW